MGRGAVLRSYRVNEVFYSLQGEGHRAGRPSVFVRFAKCNLRCTADGEAGFDCDTEFASWVPHTADEIVEAILDAATLGPAVGGERKACHSIILTGGEPAYAIDEDLLVTLKGSGFYVCIETNGTRDLREVGWVPPWERSSPLIDYICVSPKSAEHTIRQRSANEVRYVRHAGQGIPRTCVQATEKYISPAFEPDGSVKPETMAWCVDLVKRHPDWTLSCQQHKWWGVR